MGDATEQGNFKCCETLVVTNDWEEYVDSGDLFSRYYDEDEEEK